MNDKQHEGWPGYRIEQVIYLINAGTNDCQQTDRSMNGVIGQLGRFGAESFQQV
jgi:hypothetical protein